MPYILSLTQQNNLSLNRQSIAAIAKQQSKLFPQLCVVVVSRYCVCVCVYTLSLIFINFHVENVFSSTWALKRILYQSAYNVTAKSQVIICTQLNLIVKLLLYETKIGIPCMIMVANFPKYRTLPFHISSIFFICLSLSFSHSSSRSLFRCDFRLLKLVYICTFHFGKMKPKQLS